MKLKNFFNEMKESKEWEESLDPNKQIHKKNELKIDIERSKTIRVQTQI